MSDVIIFRPGTISPHFPLSFIKSNPLLLNPINENIYACIIAVVIFLSATIPTSAQINMTFPKAITYSNNIPVGWTTSSPPTSIQLIFTSRSNTSLVWTLTFAKPKSSGTFIFSPLKMLTDTNFSAVSPSTVMPDGAYTVSMSYKRASVGNIFFSASVVLTTDNITLPGFIVTPIENSFVGAKFVLKDSLPDVPTLTAGAKKIKFTKGTNTTILIMSPSTRKDSFELNVNNITGSSSAVVSASPNTLSEGLYDIITAFLFLLSAG